MTTESVVSRSSFDPFRTMFAESRLPRGMSISVVFGHGESDPNGRRVVSGVVSGYAVRSRHYIDIGLRGMRTWRCTAVLEELEALPPEMDAIVRVAIQGDIASTLLALRKGSEPGRAALPAVEVPRGHCPNCGTARDIRGRFPYCHECGTRLGLGWNYSLPKSPPPNKNHCPGCWHRQTIRGAFCVYCGYDFAASERLRSLEGQPLSFTLTKSRNRTSQYQGRIDRAGYKRVFRASGAHLVLRLSDIKSAERGGLSETLPAHTWVVAHLVDGSLEGTLQRIHEGEAIRVSEIVGLCRSCRSRGVGNGGKVWNRFCPDCGSRVRIEPFQSDLARPGRRKRGILRHACGQRIDSRTLFCGYCGEDVSADLSDRQSMGRSASWSALVEPDVSPAIDLDADEWGMPKRRF